MDRNYELRVFDRVLMEVRFSDGILDTDIEIVDYDDTALELFPCGLEVSGEGVLRWMQGRSLPANRRYASELCAALGIALNDTESVYRVGMGLSLNDSYWMPPAGSDVSFEDVNLFDNGFSEVLAAVAYTGNAPTKGTPHGMTPELVTDGTLRKAWRIVDGRRLLFKGSTPGFEPGEALSEVLCSQVAEHLGLDAVSYELGSWDGETCSVCENFATKEVSYVPFAVATGMTTLPGVVSWLLSSSDDSFERFADMIILDALCCNTDRHLSNFGVLRDNSTGRAVGLAPIFDNGRSLFPNVSESTAAGDLVYAAAASGPAFGAPSFDVIASRLIGERQIEALSRVPGLKLDVAGHEGRCRALETFLEDRADDFAKIPPVDRAELARAAERVSPQRDDGPKRLAPVSCDIDQLEIDCGGCSALSARRARSSQER